MRSSPTETEAPNVIKPNMILKPDERASIDLPWRGDSRANFEWL